MGNDRELVAAGYNPDNLAQDWYMLFVVGLMWRLFAALALLLQSRNTSIYVLWEKIRDKISHTVTVIKM